MATTESQQQLGAYCAATTTETVTQTVVLPLETSNKKNKKIRTAINEFQEMASYMADMMASIPPGERRPNNPALYRLITREFPAEDRTVGSKVALAASRKVAAAFQSKYAKGDRGELPSFGDGDYFIIDNQNITIDENDRGFGLKANFVPYEPEWFHIKHRPYTKEYLDRIEAGRAKYGSVEFHLTDADRLFAHIPVSWAVEVYTPADVSKSLGVDIGENVLYAAAIAKDDTVSNVRVKKGGEFRHYRNRLQAKRERLMEKGDLKGLKQCRDDQIKYTEQVLDTASSEIVQLAVDNKPIKIQLEDLTHYRKSATNPIHDWPFALLQEKISYKAKQEGIPVSTVDAYGTSITCRKCGQMNKEYRNGNQFCCRRCGYEVHADVNAAINIAKK